MSSEIFAFPLSFAQQRLWFLDQLDPGSPVYNIPLAVRVRGFLDLNALENTFREIVRRHEVLRTSFGERGGSPVQLVGFERQFEFAVFDLQGQADRKEEAQRLIAEESYRPFDLSNDLLLRAGVIRLEENVTLLMVTMHHIAADGWSVGVLVREMGVLYPAFCRNEPSPLEELSIQYADFACWQRTMFDAKTLQPQLAYWKEKLGNTTAVLELPADRVRRTEVRSAGSVEYMLLPDEVIDRARELSKRCGTTLFMTLLAVLNVLLYRYSGQEEIAVGSPIANRNRTELEGLIGLFINMLVLRTDLSGNPSFEELLGRVRSVTVEAYANQDVPFERLVEELQPERSFSHAPLFQVIMTLQNTPVASLKLPGLVLDQVDVHNGTSKLDLTLLVEEREAGLFASLEYNRHLFCAATARRMLSQFWLLLNSGASEPARPISELDLMTHAEIRQVLFEWNNWAPVAESIPAHQLIEQVAAHLPDRIAIVSADEQLSYGEFDLRAGQIARYLRSNGIGPDLPVGICLDRSLDFIIAMLGVLKAGAPYIPLDPSYPRDRLLLMLEDSGASLLLTKRNLANDIAHGRIHVVDISADRDEIIRCVGGDQCIAPSGSNLAYVIYTSGSTGRPKGTMIQHSSLVSYIQTALEHYGVESADRVLQFCSLSFDISVEEIYPCLVSGGTLVLRNDSMVGSTARFMRTCEEWGITMLSLPTAFWHEMTAGIEDGAPVPASLRLVIIAGERAMPERLASWSRLVGSRPRLINTYGLTESTIISTVGELTGTPPEEAVQQEVSIGRVIRNTQIYILDRNLRPVPVGVPGEIYIGGYLLARGYINQRAVTAARFVPNPHDDLPGARLYKTGDMARYREDGSIEFIGRADHQVKIRGYRVELNEIATVLGRHPSVRESIVSVRESGPGGKRLVAYFVAKPACEASQQELRDFLAERLPDYMVPSAFVRLDQLPLSPNGKVDRKALPDPPARPDFGVPLALPDSDLERAIADAWQEALGMGQVGIYDNFFDLGGHSLLIIKVHSALVERLRREVSIVEMFQYPTISALAKHLEGIEAAPAAIAAEPSAHDARASMKRRLDLRRTGRA